jgi:hypothetical protein
MSARLDLSSLLELTLKSAVEIVAGQAGLITLRRDDGQMVPWASIGLPAQTVPLLEPLWRDLHQNLSPQAENEPRHGDTGYITAAGPCLADSRE